MLFLLIPAIMLLWLALPALAQGPVLVIDAGHGGLDGGASAADGTAESGLNLSIALRVRDLARLLGLPVRMTREAEELDYPAEEATIHAKKVWDQKRRVALINSLAEARLLSIHQNNYPDPRPSGSQVLYGAVEGSSDWGEATHDALVSALCPENRRVAAPISRDIFLMRSVNCPAILVECGFLSNPAEAARLKTAEYQRRIALVLIASYLQSAI